MGSATRDPAQSEPSSRSSAPWTSTRHDGSRAAPRTSATTGPAAADTTSLESRGPLRPCCKRRRPLRGPHFRPPVTYGPYTAHNPAKNWMIGGLAVVALVVALVLIAVLSVSNVNSLINAETQLPSSAMNTVAWYWSSQIQPALEIGRDARRHERRTSDDCDFEPGRRSCVLSRSTRTGQRGCGAHPHWCRSPGAFRSGTLDRRRHALRNPPQEGRHERGLRRGHRHDRSHLDVGSRQLGPAPASTTTTTSTTVPTAVKPSEWSTPPGVKFTSVSVGFDFVSARTRAATSGPGATTTRATSAWRRLRPVCSHHRSGDTARRHIQCGGGRHRAVGRPGFAGAGVGLGARRG